MEGYYNQKVLDKFAKAYKEAVKKVKNGDRHVRISKSNTKMGNVASVSLMAYTTCHARCKGTCGAKCYAAKLANLRPVVLNSYAINTAIATLYPKDYWKEVNKACGKVKYFRFHVSGDIMNEDYFKHMVKVAKANPETEILAFTKRYEIVNAYLDSGKKLPKNLHILFSGWTNLVPLNPHKLPETNVIEKGEMPHEAWKVCGGNCFNCAQGGTGCWNTQPGDTIAFHIH